MIFIVIILGLVLRLIIINQSLWLDEAAQVIESARLLGEQLKISGDFQPPLFHILLHFWMKLGTGEIQMRLLTVMISLVSIYLLYLLGKKLIDHKFALLTSFLFAINPLAIYYSQELRPYPLTVCLALLTTLALINRNTLLLILSLTLFLYTTYLAPFFIIGMLIFVYFRERKRLFWFLRNTVISVFLFFPWLPSFIKQFQTGTSLIETLPGWGEAVSVPIIKVIPLIFVKFFIGKVTIDNKFIYGFIGFLLISMFLYLAKRAVKVKNYLLFFCLFFIPLIVSFAVTIFIPILEPKRILFTLPFFLGIFSLGLMKVPPVQRKIFLLIYLGVSLFGLSLYYFNPRFQRENWREAVSFVETKGDGRQIAVFVFPQPFAPFLWYQKNVIASYGIAPTFVVKDTDLKNLADITRDRPRVYLFQYLTELTDPEKKVQKTLENNGFIWTDTFDFPGVGFIFQYDKTYALAP